MAAAAGLTRRARGPEALPGVDESTSSDHALMIELDSKSIQEALISIFRVIILGYRRDPADRFSEKAERSRDRTG